MLFSLSLSLSLCEWMNEWTCLLLAYPFYFLLPTHTRITNQKKSIPVKLALHTFFPFELKYISQLKKRRRKKTTRKKYFLSFASQLFSDLLDRVCCFFKKRRKNFWISISSNSINCFYIWNERIYVHFEKSGTVLYFYTQRSFAGLFETWNVDEMKRFLHREFLSFFLFVWAELGTAKKLKKYVYMLLFKKEACISVFRHWNTYIFFETFTFFQKNTVNWWFMMAASLFHPFPAVKRENTDEQNIWLLVGSSSSFKMYSFDAYVRGVVVAKRKCTLFLCRLNYNFFS